MLIRKGAEGFSEIAQFIRNNAVDDWCVLLVSFFSLFFWGGGVLVALAVSRLNLKVLNYQNNLKHSSGSLFLVLVVIIPLGNNRLYG